MSDKADHKSLQQAVKTDTTDVRTSRLAERLMANCHVQLFQMNPIANLKQLVEVAEEHSGQSHHCRRILLGIYNSYEWPLELNRLRALDNDLVEAALSVIAWSTYAEHELHEYLDDGDRLMKRFWARELSGSGDE